MWAAGLLGFFLIFDFPSAVIPAASDLLMLAPHVAAVWMAWKRRPFWSGALAGVAFWISPKGFCGGGVRAVEPGRNPADGRRIRGGGRRRQRLACGAAARWAAYWREVWEWGTPLRRQLAGSIAVEQRAGAHAQLDGLSCGHRDRGVCSLALWRAARQTELAGSGPAGPPLRSRAWPPGLRFFPRYYLVLLPVVALMAARGFTLIGRKRAVMAVALLLLIPLARFGPTYLAALTRPDWRDTAMDRDSRAAAAIVDRLAQPGDTLFVWGYRPEIYVYTRRAAATRYLDSQPLTGVPADRHLTQSTPVEIVMPRVRREELARSRPDFIVDGLGPYNPRLAIESFPDLRPWLAGYREVGRTAGSVIYQAASPAGPAGRPLP